MKRVLHLSALPLLTALFTAAPASSQGAVEDALPASSFAVVRFGGLEQATGVGERLGLVRLGRILMERGAEESFRQQVIPAIEQAAGELRQHLADAGISAADLRALLSRPMALGIGRPTLFGSEMIPSVALVVDVGNREEEIARIFATLETHLVQHGPDIAVQEQDLGGYGAHVLSAAEEPGNVVIGRIGEFMVATNSRGYFLDCARVIDGEAPSNRVLAAVKQNLPEPAMISAYVNTRPILSVLDPFLPYEATEIGEAIGINGVNGIYLGVSGTETGSAEVVHLGLTGSEDGMLRAPLAGPVSLDAARYCSKDTVVYGAAALDLAAFLEAGERLFQLLPREAREEVHGELTQELGRELSRSGMTLEQLEGLLRSVGPSLTVALNIPQQPLPIPEVLAFLEVRDPDSLEPVLQRIVDESGLEWRTTTSRDREIYYANVQAENLMFSPCFTFDEGLLIVSSHVRNLRAALAQLEDPENSLATQDSFRQLQQDAEGATALLHVRGNKVIDLMWPLAESQLRMFLDGEGRGLGLNSDIVPEVDEVSQALGTASLSLHVDENGIFLKQVSNTGFGAMVAGAAMFLDAVLQTAQGRVY